VNIHEYQAKDLLAKLGVAVPRGGVAYTAAEAVAVARRPEGLVWVVKVQIHAGGRGKAGGVILARSEDEVGAAARALLGRHLVTHQTGPAGREVKLLYVEEGRDIARELYLGLLIDRETGRVTLIGSTEGGVEIEEVAAAAWRQPGEFPRRRRGDAGAGGDRLQVDLERMSRGSWSKSLAGSYGATSSPRVSSPRRVKPGQARPLGSEIVSK
jgi:ATP-grasp domain